MNGIIYNSKCIEGIENCNTLKKPKSPPKPNHCIIKVKACGVNPVDAKFCVGDKLPSWLSNSLGRWFMNNKIVGFDFSGIIEELGEIKK